MKIYNGSKGRSEAEMDGEQNGIRGKKGQQSLMKKKKQDGVMILLPSWPKASMIDITFISSFLV